MKNRGRGREREGGRTRYGEREGKRKGENGRREEKEGSEETGEKVRETLNTKSGLSEFFHVVMSTVCGGRERLGLVIFNSSKV